MHFIFEAVLFLYILILWHECSLIRTSMTKWRSKYWEYYHQNNKLHKKLYDISEIIERDDND